jgi:diaminopimelate epimerase
MTAMPFWKMSGAGNDFILIDNRLGIVPSENLPRFVAQVCRRRLSVGADGLILIEPSEQANFKWQFFNSDGSLAEMCGNGARCAARFAHLNGIASGQMAFETMAGVIRAQVMGDQVKINITDPQAFVPQAHLELNQGQITYGRINTGVPHVVVEVADIERAEVVAVGREIRRHAHFAPAGTNVNFVAALAENRWSIRTYERGVEDETLACGTGVVAAALVLSAGKGLVSPVVLQTRSGSMLTVYFSKTQDGYRDIFLEGDARIIYKGQLSSEAWEY